MNAPLKNVLRKPDAGNLHVRFDEGRGGLRSLTLRSLIPQPPSYSTWLFLTSKLVALGTEVVAYGTNGGWRMGETKGRQVHFGPARLCLWFAYTRLIGVCSLIEIAE